jgi:hypothetical protein
MDTNRRSLLAAMPAVGLASLFGGCAARTGGLVRPGELYRIDDEAAIRAAARAIVAEDMVATLITVDSELMPRARSVEVRREPGDGAFWIFTRRASRKVSQVRANPNAALHFACDDQDNGNAAAFYASFMGRATVHEGGAVPGSVRPSAEIVRQRWPNYPADFAALRFVPRWLEVIGKGIRASDDKWQPQGVML